MVEDDRRYFVRAFRDGAVSYLKANKSRLKKFTPAIDLLISAIGWGHLCVVKYLVEELDISDYLIDAKNYSNQLNYPDIVDYLETVLASKY